MMCCRTFRVFPRLHVSAQPTLSPNYIIFPALRSTKVTFTRQSSNWSQSHFHPIQVPLGPPSRARDQRGAQTKHRHAFEKGITSKSSSTTYTAAYALLDSLWELGVEHCFVNLGADHPSLIEAIVKGERERPDTWPRIITCPSEMIAISMADGYGRVSGKPQAVIVHVDVGTQALAHGVHNASIGRVPMLIFAGLCPFTEAGELPGSRTEYMHWLQEPPDQKAIVRQYCRYVGEAKTGLNIKQNVARALQFANSDPKGPSYLVAAREVLAQEIEPYKLSPEQWTPIRPSQLPTLDVERIALALVGAKRPLIITGYSGRNTDCPAQLVRLADRIPGLRVFDVGGSDICFPATHPASQGVRMSFDECTRDADTILILDCDVPWIPSRNPPPQDAQIFHIDVDPLNGQIPVSFFPAHGRWKADVLLSLKQINKFLASDDGVLKTLQDPAYGTRRDALNDAHAARIGAAVKLGQYQASSALNGSVVGSILEQHMTKDTTYVVEAVTCAQLISDQLRLEDPGTWINTGATGIGWSNGAALGVKLALDKKGTTPAFVVQLVGDGSYLCGSPATAAWVASRYGIPIVTIVLNNGGWVAPRNSTRLVYPDGLNVSATPEELKISFQPSPRYADMAAAAAGDGFDNGTKPAMLSARVECAEELIGALGRAQEAVKSGRGAFIEAILK